MFTITPSKYVMYGREGALLHTITPDTVGRPFMEYRVLCGAITRWSACSASFTEPGPYKRCQRCMKLEQAQPAAASAEAAPVLPEMLPVVFSAPSYPRSTSDECPICGDKEIASTYDHLSAYAQLEDGEYAGESKVDWDSQDTWLNAYDEPLVLCRNDHAYWAKGYRMGDLGSITAVTRSR